MRQPSPIDDPLADIHSQPEMLHRIADAFTGEGRGTLSEARTWFWRGEYHLIVFTGSGASLYAAQAVVPSLNRIGVRALAVDASELLRHGVPALAGKVAVVIVSQSGESEETRALMQALKTRVNTLAVVCDPESSLASTADLVVDVPISPDSGVALRTYTATIAVLLLLAHVVSGGVVDRAAALLHASADGAARLLQRGAGELIEGPQASTVYLIGSGSSLASAEEGALLLQRLANRPAEGLPPGRFRRGAIDALSGDEQVLLFAPQGPSLNEMRDLAAALVSYRIGFTAITNARPGNFSGAAGIVPVQYPDDTFAPLVEIVPVQLATAMLHGRLTRFQTRVSGEE